MRLRALLNPISGGKGTRLDWFRDELSLILQSRRFNSWKFVRSSCIFYPLKREFSSLKWNRGSCTLLCFMLKSSIGVLTILSFRILLLATLDREFWSNFLFGNVYAWEWVSSLNGIEENFNLRRLNDSEDFSFLPELELKIYDTRNLFYFIFLVLRDEGGDLTKDRCTLTFRGKNHIPP